MIVLGYLHWTHPLVLSLEMWCGIHITKIVLAIKDKDVCSDRFPCSTLYFMWYDFILGLYYLEIKICRTLLTVSSMSAFRLIQHMYLSASSLALFYAYMFHAAGWGLFLGVTLVLLFFHLVWQFHQLSQFYLQMTNTVVDISVLKLSLMARHAIDILMACLGACHP